MAVQSVTVLPTSGSTTATPAPAAAPPAKELLDKRPETPAATPADPAAAPPAAAGEVDIDAEDLKRWSRLAHENRDARTKIAALEKERGETEPLRARAAKLDSFDEHVKAGKHLEAAKAVGLDLEAAFAEWMQAEQGAAAPPEVRKLEEKVAALEAEREEEGRQRKAAQETEAERQRARYEEAVVEDFSQRLATDAKTDAPKYPHCALEPDAAKDAKVIALAAAKKIGKALTEKQAEAIFDASLAQLEAHYADVGKRHSGATPPPASGTGDGAPSPTRAAEPVARQSSMTIDSRRGSLAQPQSAPPKFETAEAAKRRILAAARARRVAN